MKKNTSEKVSKKDLKRKNKLLFRSLIVVLVLVFLIFLGSFLYSSFSSKKEDFSTFVDTTAVPVDNSLSLLSQKNKNYRNHWQNYITVSPNRFSYYEVGGIENLKVVASNDTDYLINEMSITVCYVIDNGSCYDTKDVYIYDIPPHSTKQEDAPDSSRGKNVKLVISNIFSDGLNFHYNPNNEISDYLDPYFTKDKY